MRRHLLVLALALVASLLLVGAAQAATPQAQIKALNGKVTKLTKRVNELEGALGCFFYRAVAITQFPGYQYSQDGTEFLTTALDLVNPSGLTPGRDFDYFVAMLPDCVSPDIAFPQKPLGADSRKKPVAGAIASVAMIPALARTYAR